MLRGHVDQISRRMVAGWAADDANPDEVIEISLYINGTKAALIPCDASRTDLRSLPGFGQGRHGFRHEFPTEFPSDTSLRVTLRFAVDGGVLGNGDAVLASGQTTPTPVAQRPGGDIRPRLAAPMDPRSLLQLLALYEDDEGLYELLRRLDFMPSRTAKHMHYAAFGEYPAAAGVSPVLPANLVRDCLNDLLHSERFQSGIVTTVLRAFPEKRRLLFVHIPKCAGSDLSLHFSTRHPSIAQQLEEPGLTTKAQFFTALSKLVRTLAFSDTLFIRGHINLGRFADHQLIRPIDRCFTVVREPIDMAVSQVNYIASRIRWNVESGALEPDTRNWLNILGVTELPATVTDEFARHVCRVALLNAELVRPNPICEWLGGGTAEEVIARLCDNDVELTDTARYNAWLREEWRIDAQTRQNESIKYITSAMLRHEERAYLIRITAEDAKVYRAVEHALAETARNSVAAGYLRRPES